MAREAIVLQRRMRRDQVAGTDHLMRAKEAQADDRRQYQRNSDPEGAFHFHPQKRKVERMWAVASTRSEEHTSELQSLMRISYAVFCLKKNTKLHDIPYPNQQTKPSHQYNT